MLELLFKNPEKYRVETKKKLVGMACDLCQNKCALKLYHFSWRDLFTDLLYFRHVSDLTFNAHRKALIFLRFILNFEQQK